MKIFKPIKENKTEETQDLVTSIFDNELTIDKKYTNLILSFEMIKSNPGSDLKIIEKLISTFGGKMRFPRVGDNNERFDAFIEFNDYYCVVEIEIPSIAILDAPRNLLDDYAVSYARNNINNKPIIPLVICWDLPNKRSDYWNVIKDIKEVINKEIKTISIPALALHYWTNTPLNLISDYYLDSDQLLMETAHTIAIKQSIPVEKTFGYLEPIK